MDRGARKRSRTILPSTDSKALKCQQTDDGSEIEELEGEEQAEVKWKSTVVQERKQAPKRQPGIAGQEQWDVPAVCF